VVVLLAQELLERAAGIVPLADILELARDLLRPPTGVMREEREVLPRLVWLLGLGLRLGLAGGTGL
jgi:hypothetical protein